MTDKQIIIDGVDVGWCKNYNEANSKDCETLYICKENPNCYYKQFKRKEQECEKLSRLSSLIRTTETYSDVCSECRDEILTYPTISGRTNYTQIEVEERSLKKIIQQLDQLKAELEAYKMEAEEGKEINAELKAENEQLKKQHQGDKGLITSTGKMNYQLIQEYDKLKTENDELKNAYTRLNSLYNDNCNFTGKLEQTLTEIKEIAESVTGCGLKCENCEETKNCADCENEILEQILQKISEVEDDRN